MMKEKTTNLCLKSKDRKNKDHLEKYKDMICMARDNSGLKMFAPTKCGISAEFHDIKKVKYSFNPRIEAQNDL